MKKAVYVALTEAGWITEVFEGENLIAAMEVRGYEYAGTETQTHLRQELQGAPKFKGLCGPMWGGAETPLRYETWKAYERLSA